MCKKYKKGEVSNGRVTGLEKYGVFLSFDDQYIGPVSYTHLDVYKRQQLVSMGIYNFTRNVDAIKFLIDNPNTYKDVAQYHQLNMNMMAPTETSSSSDDGSFGGTPTIVYEQRDLRIIGTVSYTHLDVYKRQLLVFLLIM